MLVIPRTVNVLQVTYVNGRGINVSLPHRHLLILTERLDRFSRDYEKYNAQNSSRLVVCKSEVPTRITFQHSGDNLK